MQILFHLGMHCTDGGLLLRSILRNRALLAREGIAVPGPSRYRELLGDVSTRLRGEPASADTEAMLLEAISDDDTAERIILSNENFLCRPGAAISAEGLYPKAHKSAWLRQCFPSHSVEFALAVRDPAAFLPDLFTRMNEAEARAVADSLVPERLSWSEMVVDLLDANPGAPVIVWAHEDTPWLWSELLRELTAHDPYTELEGAFDRVEQMMTHDGMTRLTEFLSAHSDLTEARRRKTIAAFLGTHATPADPVPAPPVPGWDHLAAALSAAYEADLAALSALPGVTFLAP